MKAAPGRDSGTGEDQPDSCQRDDHAQGPPVAGGPCRWLKWQEHSHARGALGDVPCEMEHQAGRDPANGLDADDW